MSVYWYAWCPRRALVDALVELLAALVAAPDYREPPEWRAGASRWDDDGEGEGWYELPTAPLVAVDPDATTVPRCRRWGVAL